MPSMNCGPRLQQRESFRERTLCTIAEYLNLFDQCVLTGARPDKRCHDQRVIRKYPNFHALAPKFAQIRVSAKRLNYSVKVQSRAC